MWSVKKYNAKRRALSIKTGRCTTCHQNRSVKGRRSCTECLEYDRKRTRRRVLDIKREVLSRYGKGGKLLCCARGCDVTDIFMLTLDHIFGGGSKERKETGRIGWLFYAWLKQRKYPKGFQTLCMNHQIKKELMRRKDGRL